MGQLMMNSSTFSWLLAGVTILLVGCAGVQRPDADICGVNASASKLHCYNLKKDYSNDGTLLANSVAKDKPISSLQDLNAGIYFSPTDVEKVKVWISDMRAWAKDHCK